MEFVCDKNLQFFHVLTKITTIRNLHIEMDAKFVLKAQNELKETEELKVEKLKEFKLWIANHDYFKNVRQGDLRAISIFV